MLARATSGSLTDYYYYLGKSVLFDTQYLARHYMTCYYMYVSLCSETNDIPRYVILYMAREGY